MAFARLTVALFFCTLVSGQEKSQVNFGGRVSPDKPTVGETPTANMGAFAPPNSGLLLGPPTRAWNKSPNSIETKPADHFRDSTKGIGKDEKEAKPSPESVVTPNDDTVNTRRPAVTGAAHRQNAELVKCKGRGGLMPNTSLLPNTVNLCIKAGGRQSGNEPMNPLVILLGCNSAPSGNLVGWLHPEVQTNNSYWTVYTCAPEVELAKLPDSLASPKARIEK